MQVDFVRVPAEVGGLCHGCVHFNPAKPHGDKCNTVNGVKQRNDNHCCYNLDGTAGGSIWKRVEVVPIARSNDPATSKGKRKVNKYEQAVLTALAGAHHTGQEIAQVTDQPINCITPRFAPLRRKGLIKDSGVRRDKQIVWVLC